jgi:hypothetical protein
VPEDRRQARVETRPANGLSKTSDNFSVPIILVCRD